MKIGLIASALMLTALQEPISAGFFANKFGALRNAWTQISKHNPLTARRAFMAAAVVGGAAIAGHKQENPTQKAVALNEASAWILPLEIHRKSQEPQHVFEVMVHEPTAQGSSPDQVYVIENWKSYSLPPFAQSRCLRKISTNKQFGDGALMPLADISTLSNSDKDAIGKKLGLRDQNSPVRVSSCDTVRYNSFFLRKFLESNDRGAVDLAGPMEKERIYAAQQRSTVIVAGNITPQMLLDDIAHAAVSSSDVDHAVHWLDQAETLKKLPNETPIFNTKSKNIRHRK